MFPSRRAHKSVINELDLKRTQLLWESNKLSEAEAKIHHTEQELAKVKKEYTTLRMKLQESTEKLTEGKSRVNMYMYMCKLALALLCYQEGYTVHVLVHVHNIHVQ